jgi:hypothetical protein
VAGGSLGADDARVEAACLLNVEVDMAPVMMPDGPTTIGTTTCKVWPLPSVVVRVIVERMMLVNSGTLLVVLDVLCSGPLLFVGVGVGARVRGVEVDCDSSSESDAAAYASSMTSLGIGQPMP